jgi:AAA+ ATPase superfamily predicted ATPase
LRILFDFRRPVKFVGRKNEMKMIEDAYRTGKDELVVLYGRRRIGKSSLVKLPRGYAVKKALISLYGPDNSLKDTGYFHHFVTLDDILNPI